MGLLSDIDKEILNVLLSPDGKYSSAVLSQKLGLPRSTIQRRRKRLEKEFLKLSYSLDLEKFGWRRVDLLISTRNGKTDAVAAHLLERDEVVFVGKSIGEHTIDLRVEMIIKDKEALEIAKGMDGVNDVVWSEIVHIVGQKRSVPSSIVNDL